MNNRINLAVIICVVAAVAIGCANGKNETPKPKTGIFAPGNRTNLEKQITDKFGKLPKKWDSIEFTKLEENAITLHLNYKSMPSNIAEVRLDTNKIASEVIDVLKTQSYDPRKEWLALFVHAQRREENGMTRRFGKTMYDFNTGSFNFYEVK